MACNCEILISYTIEVEEGPDIVVAPFIITATGTFDGKDKFEWVDDNLGPVAIVWKDTASQWVLIDTDNSNVLAYLPNITGSECPSFYPEPTGSSYNVTELGSDVNLLEVTIYLNCSLENLCDCEITLNFTSPLPIVDTTVILTPNGIVNGRTSYIFSLVIRFVQYDFIVYWDGTAWVILLTNPLETPVIYATLYIDSICPVGSVVEWIIAVDVLKEPIFNSISTTSSCDEPSPTICLAWNTSPAESFPAELYNYVFVFDVPLENTSLYIGQPIVGFTNNIPLTYSGTGVYYIAIIFYTSDGVSFYTENGPGRYIYGIALIDSEGDLIIPQTRVLNTGYLCIDILQPTPDEINQECFDILVWNKQCEFAQCVLNYTKLLKFGIVPCDMLDNLKNKKRVLEILNCYDTRDIENNTTDYNTLTYSTIKKLLNY